MLHFDDGVSYTVSELLDMLHHDLTEKDFEAVHLIKKYFSSRKDRPMKRDRQTRIYNPIQWEKHTCSCGNNTFFVYDQPIPGTMRCRVICQKCKKLQGLVYNLKGKRLCKIHPFFSLKKSVIGEQMELSL